MSTLELENIKHPDNSGNNLTLTSGGNVGIGTGSPSGRLHLQKSNDTGIVIENTTGATLSLLSTGAGRVRSSGVLIFDTGGATERMRVGSNGYVGVGTSTPGRHLHVTSGATNVVAKFESTDGIAAVEFTDNAGSAEVGTNAGAVVFYPSGIEKARISTQGYLTTPNQPAWSAGMNSSQSGLLTGYNVHLNNGNHFSNGVFTCPVAGNYFISFFGMTSSAGTIDVELRINGSTSQSLVPYSSSAGFHTNAVGTTVLYLNANDTIQMHNNSTQLYGQSTGRHSGFSGFLIG